MSTGPAERQDRPADDPEALKAEIEQTREELGDTVEQLAEKADVKSQAKARIEQGKEQARQRPEVVVAAVGGLVALLVLLRLVRR